MDLILPKEILIEICYYLNGEDMIKMDDIFHLSLLNNKLFLISRIKRIINKVIISEFVEEDWYNQTC